VRRRFLSERKLNNHNTDKGADPQSMLMVVQFISTIKVPLMAIEIMKLISIKEGIMKDV